MSIEIRKKRQFSVAPSATKIVVMNCTLVKTSGFWEHGAVSRMLYLILFDKLIFKQLILNMTMIVILN